MLDIIAEMSGLERTAILAASRLLDSPLDSLTSIAVVTRIEAAFGIVADDQVFALLAARDDRRPGPQLTSVTVDCKAYKDAFERLQSAPRDLSKPLQQAAARRRDLHRRGCRPWWSTTGSVIASCGLSVLLMRPQLNGGTLGRRERRQDARAGLP